MTQMLAHREDAQKAWLDLFASITGLPIGLFEMHGREPLGIFSQGSLSKFEPHCQLIRSLPGGLAACETDHCLRARRALLQHGNELTLCHAGLYNEAVPVWVRGEVRAVLLYGEMQIDDQEYQRRSLEQHEKAVARLALDEDQAAQVRALLLQAKSYTPDNLQQLRITLPKVEQWFYGFIDQEELLEQHLEKVSHELQTRLQAVIARAENMMLEARDLSSEEVFRGTNDLLSAAEAMGTVVQNLRQSVGEYHFQKERIAPLLYEAKRIYETEAKGRGISIRIDLASADGSTPVLEVSRYHLQNALNNLVHNAVKYSFRPRSGRPRTVNIWGRPGKGCYAITIENYGVGILPEEIASGDIFADGYQGKLTQGEYRTGSGKGLYFAKRVIDRHRGRIKASSRLMSDEADREGQPHLNQFTIYLPYEQSKEGSAGGEDDCMD